LIIKGDWATYWLFGCFQPFNKLKKIPIDDIGISHLNVLNVINSICSEETPLALNANSLRKRLGGISKSGLARLIADGKIRPMKAFKT